MRSAHRIEHYQKATGSVSRFCAFFEAWLPKSSHPAPAAGIMGAGSVVPGRTRP